MGVVDRGGVEVDALELELDDALELELDEAVESGLDEVLELADSVALDDALALGVEEVDVEADLAVEVTLDPVGAGRPRVGTTSDDAFEAGAVLTARCLLCAGALVVDAASVDDARVSASDPEASASDRCVVSCVATAPTIAIATAATAILAARTGRGGVRRG